MMQYLKFGIMSVASVWFAGSALGAGSEPDAVSISSSQMFQLSLAGQGLTAKQAEALESKLESDPAHIETRIKLLGYYQMKRFQSETARSARAKHVLWLIENHPELADGPLADADSALDKDLYQEASALWRDQVEKNPKNTKILANAAAFFLQEDRDFAEECYKKARTLEPENADWAERLAFLYGMRAGADKDRWQRSFKAYKDALAHCDSTERYNMLGDTAKAALKAGDPQAAKKYATELLDAAVERQPGWNYGNAVHHGNLVLGHIALLEGKADDAARFLILAGKTPGSPQLNSFGPNMRLALKLLQAGRKEPVLEYLELCRKFWGGHGAKLDAWKKTIEAGGTPQFGANLLY